MRRMQKFALGATALLAAATVAQAQISNDVVRIGILADQTGPYSGNGGPGQVLAAKMAVEDFKGKINGKIEVISADDQNKPDVGTNIARQWIERDGFDMIIGGSSSAIALNVSTMMKAHNKPYLISGTTSADLIGKSCSPMNMQFLLDTYAMPNAAVQSMLKQGLKTFFFITVDYTYGAALQDEATRFIENGGGKVVGSVKHPLGTTDFSSYLLQAQASKAQAVVILNGGSDLTNALKQANEYRLSQKGQVVATTGATFNVIAAMGLDIAQGLQFNTPYYWDRDETSRTWAARFMERNKGVPPTYIMAGTYSAVLHFLKGVEAAGTDEGKAVVAKMKEIPINDFQMKDVKIREDGQVMRPVYTVQVKTPAESKGKNDLYAIKAVMAPEQVYRPLSENPCDFLKK